ncbi:MAG: SUMF1/EgtB/PvdO family nonheme iron enzyme [Gemmatimonadota bacterium]
MRSVVASFPLTVAVAVSGCATAASVETAPADRTVAPVVSLQPYTDTVPGSLITFEMIPLPGGTVEVPAGAGARTVDVEQVWIGRTEVTWDAYDAYTLERDALAAEIGSDAVARPSPPYGAPDYGWGHAGYPVMSVTHAAAVAFCAWLSEKTGRHYRLPTEAEWLRAAELAAADLSAAAIAERAWHAGNSGGTTHAVAARQPDALGLYDLFGNVQEWVLTDDARLVARGGSYRDPAAEVAKVPLRLQDASWNERDPQFPKSRWWLSDAPFAGFRIVRDPLDRKAGS